MDLELAVLGLGMVSHPPYTPDLSSLDFAIFPIIRSQLSSRTMDSNAKNYSTIHTQVLKGRFSHNGFTGTVIEFSMVVNDLKRLSVNYIK